MGLCQRKPFYPNCIDEVQAFVADGKRFVVRVDAKPMAFLEMKRHFALVRELRLLIRMQ
jgi:hypothetical protein